MSRVGRVLALLLATFALAFGAVAASPSSIQFDVFLGYDGIVPEACWFPVVCEMKNDGPPFNGVIELTAGNNEPGQIRRVPVELPTGTLKRLVVPAFSTTRGYSSWDVRLLDERDHVRAEQTGLRARKQIAADTPLLGALARTASGMPSLRPILPQSSELQPCAARFQPSIFPDNPLVLEGMSALYLNSEVASELKDNQVNAIYAWLNAGGHLIVAVEQVGDINASPWLKRLMPCDLTDLQKIQRHPELQEWLQSATWATNFNRLNSSRYVGGYQRPRQEPRPVTNAGNPFIDIPQDFNFEAAELQVATGEVRDGHVVVAAGDTPLVVTASRGRGRVTALLFSPEREPFRSWKNLPTFWAKLIEVPGAWYVSSDFNRQGGWSSDGIFGAMIDTRQVHKLPIEWLLLLLIVYLVVIGPLDQFWLKKIGRPMLTWITFPTYVVLFSLLIYFIGYKLRSGESEWTDLHLVDVLARGEQAELRGRTYSSVYSPSNQRYTLESGEQFATFRGEFSGNWGGGQSSEKATIEQHGDSFKAEIFVPVWTSQLFMSDWWQPAPVPLVASVTPRGEGWDVKVENRTDHKLTTVQIVIENYVVPLGDVEAGQTRTFNVTRDKGTALNDFVSRNGQSFASAVQSRLHAFGASESGQIGDLPNSTVAASFISLISREQNQPYNADLLAPPGLDLSSVVEHGQAMLFAWAEDYSPIKPMYQFHPRRSHRNTLWRVAVSVQ